MAERKALIMSGGGFKGKYQIGALQAMLDVGELQNMEFDVVAGISVGALNAALISCNKWEELKDLWEVVEHEGPGIIYTSDFITPDGNLQVEIDKLKETFIPNYKLKLGFWDIFPLLFSKKARENRIQEEIQKLQLEASVNAKDFKGIAKNDPLYETLKNVIDRDMIPEGRYFLHGFVSLYDGVYHAPYQQEFLTNDDFIKGIVASTAMPLVWAPVDKVDLYHASLGQLLDGGLRNSNPIGDVVRLINNKFDEEDTWKFYIINNNSGEFYEDIREYNLLDISLKSLTEITTAEIFQSDMKHFTTINNLVKQAEQNGQTLYDNKGNKLRYFDCDIIQPEKEELGKLMDTRSETIKMRYDKGYEEAYNYYNS